MAPTDARDTAGPPAASRDRLWPALVIAALVVVVAVNLGFIILAVGGADEVLESYEAEPR